jgi:hypothetical protein
MRLGVMVVEASICTKPCMEDLSELEKHEWSTQQKRPACSRIKACRNSRGKLVMATSTSRLYEVDLRSSMSSGLMNATLMPVKRSGERWTSVSRSIGSSTSRAEPYVGVAKVKETLVTLSSTAMRMNSNGPSSGVSMTVKA